MGQEVTRAGSRIEESVDALRDELHRLRDRIDQANTKTKTEQVWDWLLKGSIPLVLGVLSYVVTMALQLADHDKRMAIMEATRFTAEDGRNLLEVVRNELRRDYPPIWMRDMLTRLELQSDKVQAQLEKLDGRLDVLEKQPSTGR